MSEDALPAEVLSFWFRECDPSDWFIKSEAFDATVRSRFGPCVQDALDGGLRSWTDSADGCLALILVLDQFTRNMFRGSARAFAGDERALSLSQRCVEEGHIDNPDPAKRQFMLMPMMHSEDLSVHERALPLFERWTDARVLDYELKHREIIARFGRYPHRNVTLGRVSTPDELEFLTQPGSSF